MKMAGPAEDGAIVEALFARSEEALRALDSKYGRRLRALAQHIVSSQQDAEECVNDAYLAVWNTVPPARPAPLLAYCCKIVRNLALKAYYREGAAKRRSSYTVAMEEIEACIPDRDTVESQLEAKELARILEDFLDTLPAKDRVLFLRRYWSAASCKEIARGLGITEKNVSVRLSRLRQKLKQYLMERGIYV